MDEFVFVVTSVGVGQVLYGLGVIAFAPEEPMIPDRCPACGYDRRGNPDGERCSECGAQPRAALAAIRKRGEATRDRGTRVVGVGLATMGVALVVDMLVMLAF